MSIEYLCTNCSKQVQMSGFRAINEVGRKYCSVCNSNDDDLIVVDKQKLQDKLKLKDNKPR